MWTVLRRGNEAFEVQDEEGISKIAHRMNMFGGVWDQLVDCICRPPR